MFPLLRSSRLFPRVSSSNFLFFSSVSNFHFSRRPSLIEIFGRHFSSNSSKFSTSTSNSSNFSSSNTSPDVRSSILSLALTKVPDHGFSFSAVESAVLDLGLSPGLIGIFPSPALDLIDHFHSEADKSLAEHLKSEGEKFLSRSPIDRLRYLIQYRLSLQIPFLSHWVDALALQAAAPAIPTSLPRLLRLIDELAFLSGDRSTNFDWYSNRALISAVYLSSELHLITDRSHEYSSTWKFLDRRLADLAILQRLPSEFHSNVGLIASAAFNSISALVGKSAAAASAGNSQQNEQKNHKS